MSRAFRLSTAVFVICLSFLAWTVLSGDSSIGAEKSKSAAAKVQPVDDDMHHFMEYVFEPSYKRLKAAMAAESKDRQAWKAIKGDSLTLAECSNLLLSRAPDKQADQWRKLSVEVRSLGGELYQAARKSDDAAARKAYTSMIAKCNACHKQFADGKHQLEP